MGGGPGKIMGDLAGWLEGGVPGKYGKQKEHLGEKEKKNDEIK